MALTSQENELLGAYIAKKKFTELDPALIETLKKLDIDERAPLLYCIFKSSQQAAEDAHHLTSLLGANYFADNLDGRVVGHEEETESKMDTQDFGSSTPAQETLVSGDGPSAIDMAIMDKAPLEVIEALVNYGVSVNRAAFVRLYGLFEATATPLQLAMQESRDDVVQFILSKNPDIAAHRFKVGSESREPLVSALEGAVILNQQGSLNAIYQSNPEVAKTILKENSVTAPRKNLLLLAIGKGALAVVPELVRLEPDMLLAPAASYEHSALELALDMQRDLDCLFEEIKREAGIAASSSSAEELERLKEFLEPHEVGLQGIKAAVTAIKNGVERQLESLCAEAFVHLRKQNLDLSFDNTDLAQEKLKYGASDACQEWIEKTVTSESFKTRVLDAVIKAELSAAQEAEESKEEPSVKNPPLIFSQQPLPTLASVVPPCTASTEEDLDTKVKKYEWSGPK